MNDVKPWEPVTYQWEVHDRGPNYSFIGSQFSYADCICEGVNSGWSAHVTLANGQRIIVRAKQ